MKIQRIVRGLIQGLLMIDGEMVAAQQEERLKEKL